MDLGPTARHVGTAHQHGGWQGRPNKHERSLGVLLSQRRSDRLDMPLVGQFSAGRKRPAIDAKWYLKFTFFGRFVSRKSGLSS